MDRTTHQKVIRATKNTADVECLSCRTIHPGVERDTDGATLDQQPCMQDDCTARLCSACPQFACDGPCQLTHCASHRIRFGEESWCPICTLAFIESATAGAFEVAA